MAAPPNPFAVLHQTDGAASSTGRGRGGAFNRPTPFQPRGASNNVSRDSNSRGRGRGRGAPGVIRGARGNARGAASNTWRASKPDAQSSSAPQTASPFSQLKQKQYPTVSASSPSSQQKPPFSGFGRGSTRPSSGAPSTRGGTLVNFRKDARQTSVTQLTNGASGVGAGVPVEDVSAMGSYNDRYEQLKVDRAKERERAIKAGHMADPNQPMSLNKAITPVGTCTSMCPEFERVERIVQKMVDKSEKYLHPATNSLQTMEAKMLKRFRRSAAGYDEQLPSDIRTPATLLQSMNYLTRHIIGGPEPLGIIHKFVWDRTRSIRNDFSVQQLTQEDDVKIAVTCLERIARFHIVSLHLLSSPANEEPFDRHQEREQLNNTMLSLMYYYDDNRGRISFPNEDEFRAYYIIFSIHDQRPDLEARVQKWPPELRNASRVQTALELFAAAGNTWEYQGTLDAKRPNAIAQGFYARFFSLINSPSVSYLMACVAEIYFNHMRQTAIRSIWKGYFRYPASQQNKNNEWTVDELTRVLCFDDNEQTIEFCQAQDLEFAENANGELYLDWGNRHVDSVGFQPSSDHSFSENYVESKRAGRNLVAIVLGLNVNEAAALGMIDRSLLSERSATASANQMTIDNDDSLFVSDDDNQIPSFVPQLNGKTSAFSEPAAGAAKVTEGSAQPTTGSAAGPFSGLSFPQKPNEAQRVEQSTTPNPFSSLFSTKTPGNDVAAPSAASLNPFAKPFTPSPPAQSAEASQTTTVSLTSITKDQAMSMFSDPNTSAQAGRSDKGPAPSSATPFKFPGASQTTGSQSSPLNLFQNAQRPSTPNGSLGGSSQTPTILEPAQPSGVTAGQSITSIFDAPKTSPAPSNFTSVFNHGSTPGSLTQGPQTEASEPQPPAAPTRPFSKLSQPEKKFEAPSIFSTAPKPAEQPSTLFKSPFSTPAPETSTEQPAATQKMPLTKEPLHAISTEESVASLTSDGDSDQRLPSPPADSNGAATVTLKGPHPTAQTEISAVDADATIKGVSGGIAAAEEPAQDETERQSAWIASLKEAADRRRNTASTPAGRKRVFEPGTPPPDNVAKASKVQKAEARPKKSLALSSVKPLPKLPILETLETMTARKPTEQKPEPPKPNQVDEDELLLSAARIAAESLRSGPRLLDGFSAPYEPWRSSFSPGSSVASSVAFSRSQSPQQSLVSGYDIALSPAEDLGLGRSLSRTEQRIRMTGGKGLAYKPLNLTPKKSWDTPSKK